MAKADMVLPDGTKVTIDGSPDDITKVLSALGSGPSLSASRRSAGSKRRTRAASSPGRQRRPAGGPTGYIIQLRDEGFFKAKRSLGDIQKKLEEQGHIYAITSLSPILVRLVRAKDLRRVKDGSRWAYVHG